MNHHGFLNEGNTCVDHIVVVWFVSPGKRARRLRKKGIRAYPPFVRISPPWRGGFAGQGLSCMMEHLHLNLATEWPTMPARRFVKEGRVPTEWLKDEKMRVRLQIGRDEKTSLTWSPWRRET